MKRLVTALGAVVSLAGGAASAAPGLGEEVYGVRVEPGVYEVETRYGRLQGGSDDGRSAVVVELGHGFSDRFEGSLIGEIGRDPGGSYGFDAVGAEARYRIGTLPGLGVDVGVYGEYVASLRGAEPDRVEFKALFEKRTGPLDARVNFIIEHELGGAGITEYGYAARADWAVTDDVRLGAMAFGDVGDNHGFGGRRDHFVGPSASWEIEHLPGAGELKFEAGYLFPLGAARDTTDGQLRFGLEWERRF